MLQKMRAHWMIAVYFLLAVLPFLIRSRAVFLTDPPVWPDETIYINMVETFMKTRVFATSMFGEAYPGISKQMFIYPPLYFYALAAWGTLFHIDIIAFRMFSFICILMTLMLLYRVFLLLWKKPLLASLGILAISSDVWIGRIARISRMEALILLFSALSLTFFLEAYRIKKYKTRFIVIAGIFMGCALLTHPMACLPFILLFLLSVLAQGTIREKISRSVLFSVAPFVFMLCWILSAIPSWHLFTSQMIDQYSYKLLHIPFIVRYVQLNPSFFPQLLLTACSGILLIVLWMRSRRWMDLWTGLNVIITLIVLYLTKEMWYIAYLAPVAVFAFIHLAASRNKIISQAGYCTVLGFLFLQGLSIINGPFAFPGTSRGNGDYYQFSGTVAANIPTDARVLVSALPDPTVVLAKTVKTFPFQFLNKNFATEQTYSKFLDTIDIVVANFFQEPILPSYIGRNTAKQQFVSSPGGYRATIFYLKPKEERISP
jgi:hypothetical protein